ncbi:MAG: hypothetical protein JWL78_1424 [Chloroflexi bacterium]|nr:hypothetical protein [Chloroflexota bacterium]
MTQVTATRAAKKPAAGHGLIEFDTTTACSCCRCCPRGWDRRSAQTFVAAACTNHRTASTLCDGSRASHLWRRLARSGPVPPRGRLIPRSVRADQLQRERGVVLDPARRVRRRAAPCRGRPWPRPVGYDLEERDRSLPSCSAARTSPPPLGCTLTPLRRCTTKRPTRSTRWLARRWVRCQIGCHRGSEGRGRPAPTRRPA